MLKRELLKELKEEYLTKAEMRQRPLRSPSRGPASGASSSQPPPAISQAQQEEEDSWDTMSVGDLQKALTRTTFKLSLKSTIDKRLAVQREARESKKRRLEEEEAERRAEEQEKSQWDLVGDIEAEQQAAQEEQALHIWICKRDIRVHESASMWCRDIFSCMKTEFQHVSHTSKCLSVFLEQALIEQSSVDCRLRAALAEAGW